MTSARAAFLSLLFLGLLTHWHWKASLTSYLR